METINDENNSIKKRRKNVDLLPDLPIPLVVQFWLVIFDEPIVVATVRVSDDVIEDDQPLKLELELPAGSFSQWLCFKPPQPVICIFEALYGMRGEGDPV